MVVMKKIVKIIGKDGNPVPPDYSPWNTAFNDGTDLEQCGFAQDGMFPVERLSRVEGCILSALAHIWVRYRVAHDLDFFQRVGCWAVAGLPQLFSQCKDRNSTRIHSIDYGIRMSTVLCCIFNADDILAKLHDDLRIGDPKKTLETHPDDFQYHLAFAGCLIGLQKNDFALARQQFEIMERYPVNRMRYLLLETVLTAFIEQDEKAFNKQLNKSIARFWNFSDKLKALTPTEEPGAYVYDIYTAERNDMTAMWPYLELAVARIAVRRGLQVTAGDDFFLPKELIYAEQRETEEQ